jgi:hypothetical protein
MSAALTNMSCGAIVPTGHLSCAIVAITTTHNSSGISNSSSSSGSSTSRNTSNQHSLMLRCAAACRSCVLQYHRLQQGAQSAVNHSCALEAHLKKRQYDVCTLCWVANLECSSQLRAWCLSLITLLIIVSATQHSFAQLKHKAVGHALQRAKFSK